MSRVRAGGIGRDHGAGQAGEDPASNSAEYGPPVYCSRKCLHSLFSSVHDLRASLLSSAETQVELTRPNTTPSRFAACVRRSRRARRLAGDDS